ncbi:MAG TPA: nucleotidyltransferase domain-containing protein [Candidatus Hydrogenedentes bacterium]|nr:nucleotidyltransferase domain-containing protein [Candidatus Hydrogenedentota bacterium]
MNRDFQIRIAEAAEALKEAGASEVFLFGSATRDRMNENSDVDIAISGLPPERFFKAMGIARNILGLPVDLVDLDENNPFTQYLKEEEELVRVG